MDDDRQLHKLGNTELYTDRQGIVREVLQDGKPVSDFTKAILRMIRKVEESIHESRVEDTPNA